MSSSWWMHTVRHGRTQRYDWTTGGPLNGNKYRVVPRAHTSRTLPYACFSRSGSKEALAFQGRPEITSLSTFSLILSEDFWLFRDLLSNRRVFVHCSTVAENAANAVKIKKKTTNPH